MQVQTAGVYADIATAGGGGGGGMGSMDYNNAGGGGGGLYGLSSSGTVDNVAGQGGTPSQGGSAANGGSGKGLQYLGGTSSVHGGRAGALDIMVDHQGGRQEIMLVPVAAALAILAVVFPILLFPSLRRAPRVAPAATPLLPT